MTTTSEELIHSIADIVAMNNLTRYVKKDDDHPRLRMITGATMAGLGFMFGPELEGRLSKLHDPAISNQIKKRAIYTAGGAALGGVIAYMSGPELYTAHCENRPPRDSPASQPPGGLLTVTSAGWLGYSVLLHKKTADERERQLWGLGAGSIGYLYGPELLEKVRRMMIPQQVREDATEVYSRGAAIFGALAGGGLGWLFAPEEELERTD